MSTQQYVHISAAAANVTGIDTRVFIVVIYMQQWVTVAVLSGHKPFHTNVNNNKNYGNLPKLSRHGNVIVAALYCTVIIGLTVCTIWGTVSCKGHDFMK